MRNGDKKSKKISVNDFIEIKGYKAMGKILDKKKRMSGYRFDKVNSKNDINISDDDMAAKITDKKSKDDIIKNLLYSNEKNSFIYI